MCGLEITLGKDEPPAPQAALDLVKAIVNDLERQNTNNKGKGKGITTGALKAEQIKKDTEEQTTKKCAKNAMIDTVEHVEAPIDVRTGRSDATMQLLVEVGGDENDNEMDVLHEETPESGQDIREMQQVRSFLSLHC